MSQPKFGLILLGELRINMGPPGPPRSSGYPQSLLAPTVYGEKHEDRKVKVRIYC